MVELGDQVLAGDRPLNQPAQTFTGAFIDDGHDLDRPPVGGGVELEVDRPYPIGRISGHSIGHGRCSVAFASPPLRHTQALFAPKPLDLLVIHVPAVAAGVVISRSEPAPRMVA